MRIRKVLAILSIFVFLGAFVGWSIAQRTRSVPRKVAERTNIPTDSGTKFSVGSVQERYVDERAEASGCPVETQFRSIEEALRSPTDVCHLDLRSQQLTQLPPEIGQLVNLTSLAIEHNSIRLLPEEIRKLTKLRFLYVGGNPLPRDESFRIWIRMALPNTNIIE